MTRFLITFGAAVFAALSSTSAFAATGGTITVSPDPARTSADVTFTVAVQGAQGALTYDWDFDGNGTYEVAGDTSNTKTIRVPAIAGAIAQVNVFVNDANGAGVLITKTYEIEESADTRPLEIGLDAPRQRIRQVLGSGFEFSVRSTHTARLDVTLSAVVGAKRRQFAHFSDAVIATRTADGTRSLSRSPIAGSRIARSLRRARVAKIVVKVRAVDERGMTTQQKRTFTVRR